MSVLQAVEQALTKIANQFEIDLAGELNLTPVMSQEDLQRVTLRAIESVQRGLPAVRIRGPEFPSFPDITMKSDVFGRAIALALDRTGRSLHGIDIPLPTPPGPEGVFLVTRRAIVGALARLRVSLPGVGLPVPTGPDPLKTFNTVRDTIMGALTLVEETLPGLKVPAPTPPDSGEVFLSIRQAIMDALTRVRPSLPSISVPMPTGPDSGTLYDRIRGSITDALDRVERNMNAPAGPLETFRRILINAGVEAGRNLLGVQLPSPRMPDVRGLSELLRVKMQEALNRAGMGLQGVTIPGPILPGIIG